MLLIKNATVYAPEKQGKKDLLLGGGQILAISDTIDSHNGISDTWDAQGKIVTPGFIDQHVHVIGAGGKRGFASMTPEIKVTELIACGTTTAVGLLGTDGSTRSIKSLYAKVKALEAEGISAYMYTGYYGLDPVHIMENVQDEMIFIDKVLGCKIAITDIRSSYPTDLDLLRLLRQVRVGGMIGGKKGILHLHLGNLQSKMDVLFKIVEEHQFPIENISPTHVGRTKELFEEAIRFAQLGGMIDITTGASKYTDPYKSVLYALEKGVPIEKMTFSSDGNAGLDKLDEDGNFIGFRKAPVNRNLAEVVDLVQKGGVDISEAFKIITTNPAANLGLKNKGRIGVGMDADLCCFDDDLNLTEVFARGEKAMDSGTVILKESFE
ncbi:MAG: beta-aspartyl-peptidase [Owenweeksia sp.]|nr:beta-aspartyl-peptidase [Owenweeksia sp.]MBG00178.1 beta-aspartyl-peptidase [Owenweeksia sp.]|tara:strand:+ start:4406 stop:5545 length:1140 start_codon:yes stop_codon:yes gene_type:complete